EICVRRRPFLFQAEDGLRDRNVTGVQTCALPISLESSTLNPSPFIPILTSPCTTFNFPDTISLSLDDTLVTNCPNDNSCLSFAQATLSFRQTFTSKIYSPGIFSMFGQSMTSSCFVCGKTLNE